MASKTPSFKERSILSRYVHVEYRGKNNRPKPGAYRRSPAEKYLSVNSLEVQTRNQVAAIYADIFENGNRPVALTEPMVSNYNVGAREAGVTVSYNADDGHWQFHENGIATPAYLHHRKPHNESHCGVEFVRIFEDFKEFQFSIRMVRSRTYKFV